MTRPCSQPRRSSRFPFRNAIAWGTHAIRVGVVCLVASVTCSVQAQGITYQDYNSPVALVDLTAPAPNNGIRFTQTQPWNPNYADMNENVFGSLELEWDYDYRFDPNYVGWENFVWRRDSSISDPAPILAALLGLKVGVFPFVQENRTVTVRNASFENVAVNTQNVEFRMRGGDMALDLSDATINFRGQVNQVMAPTTFGATATATLNAAAGTTNTIIDKTYNLSAVPLAVNVPATATLAFEYCGQYGGVVLNNQMGFGPGGNTVDINGGTLRVDTSRVRIAQNNSGSFQIRNGGELAIQGRTLSEFELMDGDLTVTDSTVTVSTLGRATVDGKVNLNNSTIDLVASARMNAKELVVTGSSLVSATSQDLPPAETNPVLSLNILSLADATSNLTIRSAGNYAGTVSMGSIPPVNAGFRLNGGTLTLDQVHFRVETDPLFIDGDTGTIEILNGTSQLQVEPTVSFAKPAGIAIVNDSVIDVEGYFVGAGTISTSLADVNTPLMRIAPEGVGHLEVSGSANSSLTLESRLELYGGDVALVLDPTAGHAQHIDVSGEFTMFPGTPALNLTVINDTVVPLGTKYLLFDYSDQFGMTGSFRSLADGTVFPLGVNHYRIAYADPAWAAGNSSVITLTAVVPEPSGMVIAGLGCLTVGWTYARRRRLRKAAAQRRCQRTMTPQRFRACRSNSRR